MRALGLLFAVVAVVGCKKPEDSGAGGTKAPPAPPVKAPVLIAAEAPAPDVLTLTGLVAADQRSDVTADTQGKVINVMIERGQRVKMGQAVVQLDVRSAALSAREAQANLSAARAQKTLAEQECARTKSLLEKGAITQSEFDRQSTQCAAALESVSGAQARAEMMSKSVADGLVRAPFDGLIAEKMVSPGEWVAPGKALFTLVKDDPLKINLSVPEKAVPAIKKDQRVEIIAVARPEKAFGATVTRLGAEISKSRALIVEATLDKGSDLVPGMFAEAHVIIGQTTHVVLPEGAVVKRGKTWHAFVVRKDHEVEERLVQLGTPPAAGQVTIIQGVEKGEKVVAKVTDQIVDGTKVVE
ncbi:MAG: putative Co/Zn/Cd efflux system rane fusion protein [Myxococcales bacterium]|nr:putative Co/Zn/Cd efflux system rane fusion protein [Myxococcales bacterium]